jgi:hypothetical protein
MKAMKKCRNAPMPSINSVPDAMSNMAPVRLKKTVTPVMSCESDNIAFPALARLLNSAVIEKG